MSTGTSELQDIQQTLTRLQARVRELAVAPDGESLPVGVDDVALHVPAASASPAERAIAADHALVLSGMAELATLTRLKDFPEFFQKLARQTGLRLLLLKRWSSGLQVFLEENVKLPPEARSKRRDGRAPIPSAKDDIFAAVAHDGTVYCGPVPQKHFPLDLTILLGRGARDRQIVVLPIPAQGHWNTFLYLDADQGRDPALAAAGILAHYALSRMCLLERGLQVRQGQVPAILNIELDRRRRAQERQETDPRSGMSSEAIALARRRVPEIDPFASEPAAEPVVRPLAPTGARRPTPVDEELQIFGDEQGQAAAAPLTPVAPAPSILVDTLRHALTPEIILRHSGELPALPKAACHIMAVIEDPRTTATRLEKALAMDQTLTAKVLRIANSPFYGAARQITTVSEAIVRLGFVAIRNWTLVTAARSVFLAPGAGMLYQKIWRQSVLSAMGSQLVAQAVGRVQPESVFIGGLMQNIGQLVLARSHPELFQEILAESVESGQPYHEVELRVLGFDHGELGALLLREWNLTEDLEDAVRWHHRFEQPDARNVRVAAMIALGEEIARCQGGDDANAVTEVDPESAAALRPAASLLGLTPERVADLVTRAGALKIDPHFFT
ncbi:MAG: HDOD domain-containing protein [bacterium]|nr:HDOD domain-containing protein [bacterium]